MYLCLCARMYLLTQLCIYASIHSIHQRMYACTHVCMYASMHERMINHVCIITYITISPHWMFHHDIHTYLWSPSHMTLLAGNLPVQSAFWMVYAPFSKRSSHETKAIPSLNVYINMENHHAISRKTHYFYGHVQWLCYSLAECQSVDTNST